MLYHDLLLLLLLDYFIVMFVSLLDNTFKSWVGITAPEILYKLLPWINHLSFVDPQKNHDSREINILN